MVVIEINIILALCSISCVFFDIVQGASLSIRETKVVSRELIPEALKLGHIQVSKRSIFKPNTIPEPVENNEAYGIRLNGDTQKAPPWPEARIENEKMFLLPKVLQFDEKIRITGQMSRREKITASLLTEINGSPNYAEIACQVEVLFADDLINLRAVYNNQFYSSPDNDRPSDVLQDGLFSFTELSFDFAFVPKAMGDSRFIELEIDGSVYGKVELMHNLESIRFLSVHGDVEKFKKLEYGFA